MQPEYKKITWFWKVLSRLFQTSLGDRLVKPISRIKKTVSEIIIDCLELFYNSSVVKWEI